jgi:hypothetical protein
LKKHRTITPIIVTLAATLLGMPDVAPASSLLSGYGGPGC